MFSGIESLPGAVRPLMSADPQQTSQMRKPNGLNPADMLFLHRWFWARLCGFAVPANACISSVVDIYPRFSRLLNKMIQDHAPKPQFSVWEEAERELDMLNAERLTGRIRRKGQNHTILLAMCLLVTEKNRRQTLLYCTGMMVMQEY